MGPEDGRNVGGDLRRQNGVSVRLPKAVGHL